MIVSAGNSDTEVLCTVHIYLIRNGYETILIYCKSQVCKLRVAGRGPHATYQLILCGSRPHFHIVYVL
jgi:hypothetical protein